MLQHQVKGFGARLLAQVGEQRDVAADQRLQPGADGAEDGARAHYNAAHHSERAGHAEAIQLELRRDHIVRHHSSTACVAGNHGVSSFPSTPRLGSHNANAN
jgi:hypothetical protein